MIGTDTLDRVIGADVIDADGDKIGTASEVYLDDQSGNPEWVTVKTGLFGTKESFVPIRDADLTGDGLRVPISKAKVKDAPKIDTDGHLSPAEEQELYRYYSMTDTGQTTTQTTQTTEQTTGQTTGRTTGLTDTDASVVGAAGTRDTDTTSAGYGTRDTDTTTTGYADTGTNARGTVGHDTSGPTTDDAMTLSEERVNVGTRTEEVGRARLRKYVVTENVSQTVPVSREEVRIEREPITDANIGNAMDGPAISEEEHEVVLHAEQPVVEKETVPVERVRLDTQTVTDQETVNETVRKEQVDTDDVQTRGGTGQADDDRSLADKAKGMLGRDGR